MWYDDTIENYRDLGETIVIIAASDYTDYYWKLMNLENPQYKESWTKRHLRSCPDEYRRQIEWKIHCEFVRKQVDRLEDFFRRDLRYYADFQPDWFIDRLRTRAMEQKK